MSRAQNETYLLPFDNRIEINPALAGLNKNSSYQTGNQYHFVNSEQTYNLFYASWDSYSNKLKGGVALNFSQGMLSGQNISTSAIGFYYSGFPIKINNSRILLSAGTEVLAATKHWAVAFLNNVIPHDNDAPIEQGESFFRYYIFKPKFGFLWTNNSLQIGITSTVLHTRDVAFSLIEPTTTLGYTLYVSKKVDKRVRDLYSRPFEMSPELVVFYREEATIARLRLLAEYTDKTWGAFVQNDFTNHISTLGGTIGYRHNFMRFNLNAGMGIPGISDYNSFMCELSLNIIVPPFSHSKYNPWAPAKN
ncbi:type IX secretion system membrane protein PorP/SprF [uncultured Draconibacterium sp.]|uniref:type IX secretion system membrane protein PorP/SprF n=1 Tax=uncultured Draconibacterium sp. TaxID=1573823 RepID=UPI0029C7ED7D|nr:type IX secretion system membrane protein PorP/SprF [uncultured Draconibacterium sp.]